MKIVFLDSTAIPGTRRGPGSPAFFSRYAIQHLQQQGHEIAIIGGYEDAICLPADVVIAEWCNELAYQAAERPLKKLIIRMRGYDVYGPLDTLKWENVDALVYESPLLKQLAEERFSGLRGFRTHVIPSGVDLANIPFRTRAPDEHRKKIVALIARTTSDKGYQLAYEWARSRPDVELHVTGALGDANPRLTSYLDYAAPPNVTVHGTVDTIPWLQEIKADYLLSASIHESLGYVIAEAMAMGIKPLIHDAPGITTNWPLYLTWRSFADLDRLLVAPYDSIGYREFVEQRLDAEKCSTDFAALVEAPGTRTNTVDVEALRRHTYDHSNRVFAAVRKAIDHPSDMRAVDAVVTDYRSRLEPHSISSTERYGIALATACAHFNHENYADAEVWACRAMMDFGRPDALCMMGEIADARGALEDAVQWYEAACAMEDVPDRYRFLDLVQKRFDRRDELKTKLEAARTLPPAAEPERYIVIVTVRNGAKWIERCLDSIRTQTVRNFECIVVDDCSTDGTGEIAERFGDPEVGLDDDRFFVQRNTVRRFQAYNTVQAARTYATRPEDVVMLIDGDDWLLNDHAFEVIRDAYKAGAWMTYGCLIESAGRPSRFGYYPYAIARASRFREHVWCATPPRTFKRFLLDHLTDEDFMLEGKWPQMAGDVCVYTPIMELAAERAVGIRTPIYAYNVETPDNEHKVDPYETTRIRDLLLQRTPKKRLERP